MEVDVDFPDRVGIDRLVSAYAASMRFSTPLIVVDAGSAVTIDFVRPGVSERCTFAGGAIFPGLHLQHAALATGTEGLRLQTAAEHSGANFQPLVPARNTETAIRVGVLAAIAGGVDRLVQEYQSANFSAASQKNGDIHNTPRLVLTGGDGPTISAYLRAKHDLVPNLVCLGLMDLAGRQCRIAPGGLK